MNNNRFYQFWFIYIAPDQKFTTIRQPDNNPFYIIHENWTLKDARQHWFLRYMGYFICQHRSTTTRLACSPGITDYRMTAFTWSDQVLAPTYTRNHKGQIFILRQRMYSRKFQCRFLLAATIDFRPLPFQHWFSNKFYRHSRSCYDDFATTDRMEHYTGDKMFAPYYLNFSDSWKRISTHTNVRFGCFGCFFFHIIHSFNFPSDIIPLYSLFLLW